MSKVVYAEFWNVMEDILLNKNTVKNVILQEKEGKTKTKKRHEKKSLVDLLWQFNAWLDLWQIFIFMISIWPDRFPIPLATESMLELEKYSSHQ